jgi:hypothetical protein
MVAMILLRGTCVSEKGQSDGERDLGDGERDLGGGERGLSEAERGLGGGKRELGDSEGGLDLGCCFSVALQRFFVAAATWMLLLVVVLDYACQVQTCADLDTYLQCGRGGRRWMKEEWMYRGTGKFKYSPVRWRDIPLRQQKGMELRGSKSFCVSSSY